MTAIRSPARALTFPAVPTTSPAAASWRHTAVTSARSSASSGSPGSTASAFLG
ncbi:MAG TPA: hypothetical protein VG268_18860 [Streptosporangiaceae bacterium]|nr:hypothetical protein [Streptosporangiaceae bacterium]